MNFPEGNDVRVLNGRLSMAAQVLFAASLAVVCTLSPVTYARFIAEDHWGEYATFAAFFVSSGLFAAAVWLSTGETWKRRGWHVTLSFATFVVAMEEISWGQRILSIATPEALSKINNQNELTFHNISFVENVIPYTSVVSFAVLGYGFLAAALSRILPGIGRLLDRSGFVFPALHLAPTFLLASWLLMLPFYKSEELGELFVGFGMMLCAADHLGRRSSGKGRASDRFRTSLIAWVGIILLWIVLAYGLAPALIESAYKGESLPLFNDLLNGRASHALAEYLGAWRSLSNVGSAFLGVVATVFGMFAWSARQSDVPPRSNRAWPAALQALVLIGAALFLGVLISAEGKQHGSFHVMLGELADRAIDNSDHSRARELLGFMEEHGAGPRRDLVYRRARLARARGDEGESTVLLHEALALEMSELERADVQPARWHRIAEVHSLLGDSARAMGYRDRLLHWHDQQLAEATSDETRADLYLGRANILVSMNRIEHAIDAHLRASRHAVHGIQRKRIWLGIVQALDLCPPASGSMLRDLPAYWDSDSWKRVQDFAKLVDEPGRAWCSESW